jgi:hypothetical protein
MNEQEEQTRLLRSINRKLTFFMVVLIIAILYFILAFIQHPILGL